MTASETGRRKDQHRSYRASEEGTSPRLLPRKRHQPGTTSVHDQAKYLTFWERGFKFYIVNYIVMKDKVLYSQTPFDYLEIKSRE